jgi:chaperonin GroES
MNLEPTRNNVVLELDEKSQIETPSGLILPNERKPEQGKVVAKGHECTYVQIDDVAFFGKFNGEEMKIEDSKYLIIKETDLLAVYR